MAEFGGGPVAPERLHALDAVRGFALLLGIVLHATLSFVPTTTRFWIIQDSHPSTTLAVLFFVIHIAQVIRAGWNNFRAMVTGYELTPQKEQSHA